MTNPEWEVGVRLGKVIHRGNLLRPVDTADPDGEQELADVGQEIAAALPPSAQSGGAADPDLRPIADGGILYIAGEVDGIVLGTGVTGVSNPSAYRFSGRAFFDGIVSIADGSPAMDGSEPILTVVGAAELQPLPNFGGADRVMAAYIAGDLASMRVSTIYPANNGDSVDIWLDTALPPGDDWRVTLGFDYVAVLL